MNNKLTKKSFLNNVSGYTFTEEECKTYIENFGKDTGYRVANTWHTFMGHIGHCELTFITKTNKEKDFSKHPDWRPLAVAEYIIRYWSYSKKDTIYERIISYAQSWEEIRKESSDTENMTWVLYKHPVQ